MRIALLSVLGREPAPSRAAFANFAGAMIVERQLDLAIRLGCKRVACIVEAVESEVVRLQHRAEQAGLKFRAIRQPSRLSGMVDEGDELLVFASAVLPDDEAVVTALDREAILAFSADMAVPLGYERSDNEQAWSVVWLISGKTVGLLGQLPEDIDVPSSLMRLGLQTGTPVRPLDRKTLSEGRWHLSPGRETLDLREKNWIDAQRRDIAFLAPGLAVAERVGGRLARDLLGTAAEGAPAILAAVASIAALGAGAFGATTIGLGLVSLAALFKHVGGVVERVARIGRAEWKSSPLLRFLDYAIDPIFILMLIIAAPAGLGAFGAFVPLVLFGLLRLGQRHSSERWRATYADRISLGALILPAAFFGLSTEAAAILALLVLATRFFDGFRES